jgi:hypothetical protein
LRCTAASARWCQEPAEETEEATGQERAFRSLLGAIGDFVEFFFANHVEGSFDEVADHRFHVAAHVTDFGVF